MQIQIKEIIVKNRIRKNLGDLSSLMDSISKFGLLNPIVINSRKELIAGHRRLESCKRLGLETVQVRIITSEDPATKLEMEIDENLHRKNLSPEELADAYIQLDKLRRPPWWIKMWNGIKDFFRRIFRKKSHQDPDTIEFN
jgi:ParB family chromosome partitioning protein